MLGGPSRVGSGCGCGGLSLWWPGAGLQAGEQEGRGAAAAGLLLHLCRRLLLRCQLAAAALGCADHCAVYGGLKGGHAAEAELRLCVAGGSTRAVSKCVLGKIGGRKVAGR